MKTITLLQTRSYDENSTSKYWRTIESQPQTVELKTWSTNHPLFILEGIVTKSHDEKEIGTVRQNCVQTYSFWLEPLVNEGIYQIN